MSPHNKRVAAQASMWRKQILIGLAVMDYKFRDKKVEIDNSIR